MALLLCYLLIAVAIAEVAGASRPLRYLRERLPVLAVMTVAGVALLAIPLLLTLQFAELSNRPAELLEDALKGSLYPANLATLAVADVFATHGGYFGPNGATLPDVAHTDDSFNYLFVGWLPLILLLWFGIAGGGAWRPGRRLLAAALGAALLFMLGRYTPLFAFAFEHIPGIDMFRRPVDASFVFSAALALLCGHLLSDYVARGIPPRRGLIAFARRARRMRRPCIGDRLRGTYGQRHYGDRRRRQGHRHSARSHRRARVRAEPRPREPSSRRH